MNGTTESAYVESSSNSLILKSGIILKGTEVVSLSYIEQIKVFPILYIDFKM
jgi:hypothetical protein